MAFADESTRWGTIRELDDEADGRAWESAWSHLIARYRPVLVSYARGLLRRMGGPALAANDAEEVVDGFLAACVEKGWLSRADPELGRFRVFIRVLLARYVGDWMDKRHARKRMPESGAPASLEPGTSAVGDGRRDPASALMNRDWAMCMARAAIERVRTRSTRNAIVLEHLLRETSDFDVTGGGREALAARLGKKPPQVALIVFQARRMMAEELWAELRETVSDVELLDQERRALRPFLEHYLDAESAESFFGPLGPRFSGPKLSDG